jgi:TonB family protein
MDNSEKLIKKPFYPGGKDAMSAFIAEHMVYPQKAIDEGTEGTVAVVIDIDHLGYVQRSKVKKGVGNGLDEEAMRLASLLRFRTGNRQKQKITFHRTINIHFRLPKKTQSVKTAEPKKETAPAPQQNTGFQINYSYVPKKK